MKQETRRRICLIYTGGTIGMRRDPKTGVLGPFDFTTMKDEFPYIDVLAVDIEVVALTPIDSSNVTPELWSRLALIIENAYKDFDGFVILHGTDTMAYTASALSFMLENLTKPVVFTGSQIPIGVMRTDGRENLITAIEIASAHENGLPIVPEVSLYFQNRLFRGNRVSKVSTDQLNAFESENYPPLATVGVNIDYHRANILYPKRTESDLRVSGKVGEGVIVVKLFPGISLSLLHSILLTEGVRAVVLETYGTGNAPTDGALLNAIEEAISREIAVVNISQCANGSVEMELYETGVAMARIGVISGRDMTVEAAVTKLQYLLGKKLSYTEIVEAMSTSLRGELTYNVTDFV